MLDLNTRLRSLRRPALLARAARFGADEYRRDVHLRPIIGGHTLPRHGPALIKLLEIEAGIEAARRAKQGTYRPAHHVNVLIAIAAEARDMRAATLAPVK